MSLSPGTRLGPYEIIAPLGAGGMGEVYRAKDSKLRREVAIKVLPESLAKDSDARARFEREAHAVAALNHPNILSIHDFGESEGIAYAVMELLEGETLREKLEGGALPIRRVVDYGIQIARGLAAAHEKGVVHRDLKPENLFVSKDGHVKILDFGLAKVARAESEGPGQGATETPTASIHTTPGTVMGTVGYMSPEQVKGRVVDHRSDIFSLGSVLYEMAAGRRAFQRETTAETMTSILREEPPEISRGGNDGSFGLDRVIRHCLEKDGEQRFQSARDLAFALENSAEVSGATRASGLHAPLEERRGTARRTLLWAAGSAAAAALLTAILLHNRGLAPIEYSRITFRVGSIRSGRFSPDGQTIVYSASWEGRPLEVYTVSSDGSNPRSLGNPGAVVRSISTNGDIALTHAFLPSPTGESMLATLPRDGGAPKEVLDKVRNADWGPDGSELAVVHRVGDKDVLEYPIGTKLYETASWLFSPRVSPDGRRVAVFESSAANSSLITVDRRGGKQVFATGLHSGFPTLAWSPEGTEIWMSHFLSSDPFHRKTYAVDARGRIRLLFQDPSLTDLLDVARDGRALFIRNIQRIAARIKGPGDAAERDFSWLDATRVADISADGKRLIFGEGYPDAYRASFGLFGAQTFMLTLGEGLPTSLGAGSGGLLSSDGAWVLGCTTGIPQKAILLPTGPGQPRLPAIPGLAAVFGGKLLPDGRQALVVGREPNQAPKSYIVDLETGPLRLLSDAQGIASFDGTQFAFRDRDGNLSVTPIAGGASRSLGKLQPRETPVRWSVDGKALYLALEAGQRATGTGTGIAVDRWDLATGTRTPWKHFELPASPTVLGFTNLVIAPEADAYAYSYGIQQASDLFVVKGIR